MSWKFWRLIKFKIQFTHFIQTNDICLRFFFFLSSLYSYYLAKERKKKKKWVQWWCWEINSKVYFFSYRTPELITMKRNKMKWLSWWYGTDDIDAYLISESLVYSSIAELIRRERKKKSYIHFINCVSIQSRKLVFFPHARAMNTNWCSSTNLSLDFISDCAATVWLCGCTLLESCTQHVIHLLGSQHILFLVVCRHSHSLTHSLGTGTALLSVNFIYCYPILLFISYLALFFFFSFSHFPFSSDSFVIEMLEKFEWYHWCQIGRKNEVRIQTHIHTHTDTDRHGPWTQHTAEVRILLW